MKNSRTSKALLIIVVSICEVHDVSSAFVFPAVCDGVGGGGISSVVQRCASTCYSSGSFGFVSKRHQDSVMLSMADTTSSKEDLDASAEYVRQQLAQKQAEYEAQRRARAAQSLARETAGMEDSIPSLASLPLIPYIDSESGLITKADGCESAKASVYAVYDRDQVLQFVGVSRNVMQSLRMQLARCPEYTHHYRVYHIRKPSRSLLDLVRDKWFEENGKPPGNDGAALQNRWESALDVKPLMTAEDHAAVAEGRDKSKVKEEMAMKKIARRFEDEKVAILTERGVKEELRFDPKLKGQGLLDLYTEKPKDVVPSSKPRPKKKKLSP